MSYELRGKVKELLLTPIPGKSKNVTFLIEKIKLVPDVEYTLKDGDTKKCLVVNDKDAKLLEYDQYIIVNFVTLANPLGQLCINAKIHLTFDSCSTVAVKLQNDINSSTLGPSDIGNLTQIGILA